MGSPREDVGREGRSTLDGHLLTSPKFVEGNFCCEGPGQRLGVTHQACGGQAEVVPNAEELLHALVGDEMTHGRAVVGSNHGTSVEGDPHGAGSGLEHALRLALHHDGSPPRPRKKHGLRDFKGPKDPYQSAVRKGSLHWTSTQAGAVARRAERDEGQFSLDAFEGRPVPSAEPSPLPGFDLPSLSGREANVPPAPSVPSMYHDLRTLFPAAPVPVHRAAPVIHRADLHGLEGVAQVMNWTADGDIVLLDVGALFGHPDVFHEAILQLKRFVEGDLDGRLLQLTDTRVLVLPPGIEGLRGVDESPGSLPDDPTDGRRW